MADKSAYERTCIDWDRLKRYAARVAKEATLPLNPAIEYTVPVQETVVRTERRRGFLGLGAPKTVEVRQALTVSKPVTVVGQHWCLSQRRWHHRETTTHRDGATLQEETHDQIYLLLLPNGLLQSAWVSKTELMQWGGIGAPGVLHAEVTHHCGDPSENDVCRLDFERYYREWHERSGNTQHHYWTDRDPGRKLLRQAKGVGVNLALKAVLEGRQPTGT